MEYAVIPMVKSAVCSKLLELVPDNKVCDEFLEALENRNSNIWKCLEFIVAYNINNFIKDCLKAKLNPDSPIEKFTEGLTGILTKPVFDAFNVGDDKWLELDFLLCDYIQESPHL
ncbi:MAG: hypothetical protein LBB05_02755 [Puniceicoccales bacterium]|jgi:hypothetical protein|nr:hypothetical protein [Puniceicoccales bacterium]